MDINSKELKEASKELELFLKGKGDTYQKSISAYTNIIDFFRLYFGKPIYR